MRLHTLVLILLFSIACLEAPPDEGTDPNNISENNIGNNVVSTNNTTISSNNTSTNNTSTNNTSTNNTSTNNTSTNNTSTNNSTITGQYTVTLTSNQMIPGAENVPLYVVLLDSSLPQESFALQDMSGSGVYTEIDSHIPNRLAFWIRWPDLGSLDSITLDVVPGGNMLNPLTWEGYQGVWHMRNGPMGTLADSTQNLTNLSFETCTMNCTENENFLGRALKTNAVVSTTSMINLANDWSVSLWVRIPITPEGTIEFFSMEGQSPNRFSLELSAGSILMKTGGDQRTSIFGTVESDRLPANEGWYHVAVQSRNGDLWASLSGASFTRGSQFLTTSVQGQVDVRLGASNVTLSLDEVWIGNTSAENLNAIYQNQLQALPASEDRLIITAALTYNP